MPYSTAPNVHYQNGFKGWTMLRKDGKGMTVKHEDVGLLAQRVHDELVQLKDGAPLGTALYRPRRPSHSCAWKSQTDRCTSTSTLT